MCRGVDQRVEGMSVGWREPTTAARTVAEVGGVKTKALGLSVWQAQPHAVFRPCVHLTPFCCEPNGTDGA